MDYGIIIQPHPGFVKRNMYVHYCSASLIAMVIVTGWCLIVFYSVFPVTIGKNNLTINRSNLDLSHVTLFLARERLSLLTPTVVIAEHSLSPEGTDRNIEILEFLLQNLQGTIAVDLIVGNFKSTPPEYYIFIVDSFQAFQEILWKYPENNYYQRHFYFLIVLTKITANIQSTMTDIFNLSNIIRVIDVNILIDHPSEGVCMYTYRHFSETKCRTIIPVISFKFNLGIELLEEVFKPKLADFQGCPMRVAARIIPPLLNFSGNRSNPEKVGRWENLAGIEGELLKYISKALNFSIELLPFSEKWVILNDTSFLQSYHELNTGEADIAVGGHCSGLVVRSIFSQTRVYHYTPYRYVVRVGRRLGPFGRLATPMTYSVWILIILLVISGATFVLIIQSLKPTIRQLFVEDKNDNPLTNFVAILLGYAITRTPRGIFARCLLMSWLLFTLIIRNAYQGSMYDAIRMDKYVKIPSTYQDLIDWKYKILASPDMMHLNTFPKDQIVDNIFYDGFDRFKMIERSHEKLVTIALHDQFIDYLSKGFRFNGSIHELVILKDVILVHHAVMFMPKHSIFVSAFDRVLKSLEVSGIINYIRKNCTATPALINKFKEKPAKKRISNENLQGSYYIYAGMIFLAIIVFGLELFSKHSEKLRLVLSRIN